MAKDYRTRGLSTTYQVAEDDGTGNPAKNADGSIKLAHGGLRLFRVAGHEKQDNKRLLPVDWQGFFAQKAKEVKDQLLAAGVTANSVDERGVRIFDQVTPQAIIEEYANVFSNPGKTFMPRDAEGRPLADQFTIIVSKTLCVNRIGLHGAPSTSGQTGSAMPMAQSLSIFNRLRSAARPGQELPFQQKAKRG